MSTTGFVYHPDCLKHSAGPDPAAHPERPQRLDSIQRRFEREGLLQELDCHRPLPASNESLALAHTAEHVQQVEAACASAPRQLDPDTGVSSDSFVAARLAAGGALEACERVLEGTWRNAFCALRPPGHHAEADRAMGFCLFNNVAVAARMLRARGLERVAILDWDVHHGNGTQHTFENDDSVLYVSLHQWPFYPGTGAKSERGFGAGEGATLNCPLPAGAGDAEWLGSFEREALPALDAFAPDFLLISAGFDAHADDPLGQVRLSTSAFGNMTRAVRELAERHAQGRLVSLLEGGYDLEALADSAQAHVEALLETPA